MGRELRVKLVTRGIIVVGYTSLFDKKKPTKYQEKRRLRVKNSRVPDRDKEIELLEDYFLHLHL
jgi:hypothetical protein